MDERRHSHGSSHHHHHHKHHRHKRGRGFSSRRPGKQQIIIGLIAVVVLLVGFGWLLHYIRQWETEKYRTQSGRETVTIGDQQTENARFLNWNGAGYRSRNGLSTLLLIGVNGNENSRSADLLALFATDTRNETWQVLLLDADTACDVSTAEGTVHTNLAQAHAAANREEKSFENTVGAVSSLLEGQPIDGYLALDTDYFKQVTDSLGGIAVTIPEDMTSVNAGWIKDTEILLDGDASVAFLLSASEMEDGRNVQQAFLTGAMSSLKTKADTSFYASLWKEMQPFAMTNWSGADFTSMAAHIKQYRNLGITSIMTEDSMENGIETLVLNEQSRMEVILFMFFEKTE